MSSKEKIFRGYPLTSKFLEFSKISDLYFKNFPEDEGGFYLPALLKSIHKEHDIPEFVFEIADFENSTENLKNLSINSEKIMSELQPGEVRLNPAHSVHRFDHDILTFSRKELGFSGNPEKKPNITFMAKDLSTSKLTYLKGTARTACIVDYLAEGKMNLRILSAQLQRNFPHLFLSNDAVVKSLEKLKKKFIVLQK